MHAIFGAGSVFDAQVAGANPPPAAEYPTVIDAKEPSERDLLDPHPRWRGVVIPGKREHKPAIAA